MGWHSPTCDTSLPLMDATLAGLIIVAITAPIS
jgi:hypothetical protein